MGAKSLSEWREHTLVESGDTGRTRYTDISIFYSVFKIDGKYVYIEYDEDDERNPSESHLVGYEVQLFLEPCWVQPENRKVRQLLADCGESGCNYGWIAHQHPLKPAGVTSHITPCEVCNKHEQRPYAWFVGQSGIQERDS